MRPKSTHTKDPVDRLLDQTWEQPPISLEHELLAIPNEIQLESARVKDRISVILNAILIIWFLGLGVFFWEGIETSLLFLSKSLISITSFAPQLLADPIVAPLVLSGLLAGWVWFDLQRQSSGNHSSR